MSEQIQRYALFCENDSATVGESSDGEYVAYSDHLAHVAKAEAERDQWKAAVETMKSVQGDRVQLAKDYDQSIAELEALRRGNWVKCSERMPEPTRDVLVYGRDEAILVACLKSDGSWEQNTDWVSGRGDYYDDRMWEVGFVTHWQPLPLPPADVGGGEVSGEP